MEGSVGGANVCCIMGYIMPDKVIGQIVSLFSTEYNPNIWLLGLCFVKMMIARKSAIFPATVPSDIDVCALKLKVIANTSKLWSSFCFKPTELE